MVNLRGLAQTGKGLGLGGVFIRSKDRISLGANNFLGPTH
jgi:hypothetical protein